MPFHHPTLLVKQNIIIPLQPQLHYVRRGIEISYYFDSVALQIWNNIRKFLHRDITHLAPP